ncbi:Amidase (plasmid) [Rhizobium leguminosarum bv. trifolii WSM2304]|uniref:Indoleacetamide hydrolase n=1 Tax=Rhizobium leguminosarum bv. trifolii (strain WSM2304) TaxID=395492 RepID=A0ABF7QZ95_RHILW|nr:amidase [Rhizobium leguminosarum]ACI59654.1 Amidase [Rhizobium leguminosarum bv. trifolii WSM2304]
MNSTEYRSRDAIDLARMLHNKELTPLELMDIAIERAESVNVKINALCNVNFEHGREIARSASLKGRFGALPFLLKDSGLGYPPLSNSLGSRLFAGLKIDFNSTLTERFLDDGMLPFGRTTVPEFSMAPTTEAVQNGGPTRNPWDQSRSPGGSSGGAAAAVASGIIPLAHGSDGGGSIRIPASCCGIYGLKPSRGLIPAGPARGEGWGGLATDGVLSRSVRDTAAALDGVAGMELGAPYAAPKKSGAYTFVLNRPFEKPKRIAMWSIGFDDIPIDPECHLALQTAKGLLEKMGHEVVDAPLPPIQFAKFVEAQINVMAANVTVAVNGKVRNDLASGWEQKLEPAILDAYQRGRALNAETYALAITRFHTIGRQLEVYIRDYDFILTPTLMQPPVGLGFITTNCDFASFRTKISRYATFLAIINASGQPAASIPLHWSKDGLPIGVQMVAPFGGEADLLRMSARLEEAQPWFNRTPEI